MARIYSDIVDIPADGSRVWDALTATESWSEWRAGLVSALPVTGAAFETGFRWCEKRHFDGSTLEFEVEVTDCVPLESISLIVDSVGASVRKGVVFFEFRLVDYGETTTLHLDSKLESGGWLQRLFSSGNEAAFLALCRTDLTRLEAKFRPTT